MCKGANAAGPRAKVQRWMQAFGVAGGKLEVAICDFKWTGRADHPWSAAAKQGCLALPELQLGQHAVLPLPRDNLTAGIRYAR